MQPERNIRSSNSSNGKGLELRKSNQTSGRSRLYLTAIPGRKVIRVSSTLTVESGADESYDVDITIDAPSQRESETLINEQSITARSYFRLIADALCNEHPTISTDPDIFGGNPHLSGIRLTVSNILASLYVYGSTKAVADIYAPHVSEEQIKEAIAYAQDFLETAVHSSETP